MKEAALVGVAGFLLTLSFFVGPWGAVALAVFALIILAVTG